MYYLASACHISSRCPNRFPAGERVLNTDTKKARYRYKKIHSQWRRVALTYAAAKASQRARDWLRLAVFF